MGQLRRVGERVVPQPGTQHLTLVQEDVPVGEMEVGRVLTKEDGTRAAGGAQEGGVRPAEATSSAFISAAVAQQSVEAAADERQTVQVLHRREVVAHIGQQGGGE